MFPILAETVEVVVYSPASKWFYDLIQMFLKTFLGIVIILALLLTIIPIYESYKKNKWRKRY